MVQRLQSPLPQGMPDWRDHRDRHLGAHAHNECATWEHHYPSHRSLQRVCCGGLEYVPRLHRAWTRPVDLLAWGWRGSPCWFMIRVYAYGAASDTFARVSDILRLSLH